MKLSLSLRASNKEVPLSQVAESKRLSSFKALHRPYFATLRLVVGQRFQKSDIDQSQTSTLLTVLAHRSAEAISIVVL